MFDSLFSTTDTVTTAISLTPFVVSVATALALGLVVALCYCFKSRYNKGFVTTLAMLPAIVSVVIAMVNGNVGAGVAVAGAFSLVRFRSVAGSARDIGFIFLSMAIGLVCGMGYVGYAALITAILCGGFFVYQLVGFGSGSEATDRTVRITVPEDLDYTSLFDRRDSRLALHLADSLQGDFGRKFIILPNPMYGEWENAIYGHNYSLPMAEKNRMMLDLLRK